MDHSIYGYLSRRSKEELEEIIKLYSPMVANDYYKHIVDLANHFLEKLITEDQV